ncbi:ABC transporter permease [Mesorhizobium sp. CA8]|uniref:ABC transporter permease n=1 Tax=unclassified Mesorhizobium TaxID=325217 RepID=UPI001CCCF01A|nr:MULTISPECIES: ABC transporter permease [unclassified Mesorhizobium]MBZ9761709.1 ABC transporter permease [Mesorhizobium sp. CA8]MBZ9820537.1 ABC transporter permease [Mesorhizobium sp. CA4]
MNPTVRLATRVGSALATMLVASFLVFVLLEYSSTNVSAKILGPYSSESSRQMLSEKLGLNDPLLVRYLRWIGVVVGLREDPVVTSGLIGSPVVDARYFGNFGYSQLYKKPVVEVVLPALENTALLATVAFFGIALLGMLIGIVCGAYEGSAIDRSLSLVASVAASVPEYASAVILMFVFVVTYQVLPGASNLDTTSGWSVSSQLILPAAVLIIYDFGYVARTVRTSMTNVMRSPYIKAAILKGLSFRRVVFVHALKNAMVTPFTVILLQIGWLVSGVVVTEVVFGYPGFGRVLLEASLSGDIALVEACTLISLVVVILTQVASDVGYMVLNPEMRARA